MSVSAFNRHILADIALIIITVNDTVSSAALQIHLFAASKAVAVHYHRRCALGIDHHVHAVVSEGTVHAVYVEVAVSGIERHVFAVFE